MTILWALGLPFVALYGWIKLTSIRSKSKKYQKYPGEFLDGERYADIYRLYKIVRYICRSKIKNQLGKDKLLIKPQLIICNHRSNLDPILMFGFCYEQLKGNFIFVGKKELEDGRFGSVFKYFDTLFLDRNNPRQALQIIEKQKDYLKNGKTVIIFPEGTRSCKDEFLEFKSGALEAAYKTMCPIQPILLFNTEKYLEKRKEYHSKKPVIEMLVMPIIQPNKFITIERQIFCRNLQKTMQAQYTKYDKLKKS